MSRRAVTCILAFGLLISACGGSDVPDVREPQPTDMEAPNFDTTTVDTSSEIAVRSDTLEWSTEPIHVAHSVPEIAAVGEIRVGRHDDFERLVVETSTSVIPGYGAGYLDGPPIECGSGRSVEVEGEAILELRIEPARGHDDRGQSTVDHGERAFEMGALREAEISCDFEAIFTIILGLDERREFRIIELPNPSRIVLDVRTED